MKIKIEKVNSIFPEVEAYLAKGYTLEVVADSVFLVDIDNKSKTIKISKELLQ